MKKPLFIRLFFARFALILTVVAPLVAQASLFSLVSKVLERGIAEEKPLNSQTLPVLQSISSIDPKLARGGGDITIVDGTALLAESGPSGTLAEIEKSTSNGEISIYVVKKGDTLSAIAKMFGVSSNTILWANDLQKGSALVVGQTLVILPISGVRHIVKKGDTLSVIAKKYGGDLDEIKDFNDLEGNSDLKIGMEITIPDGVIGETPRGSTGIASSPLPSVVGYFARPVAYARKTQGIHGYNGVDLAGPTGTEIYASAGGQVIVSRNSGWNGGYGNYLVVKHPNGTQTLYAHNSQNLVSVGTWVTQGQVIALMGNTGRSTGSHVHFEVRGAKNPF
ncbi:MAG: peptidoglycan DD-metalloendopeptidase family protein [Patescibacteria group bacterium]